ncbi:hypothetical protein KKB18_06635, partial [bacterium]|nr:hypothetical protein [bacterium]
MVSTSKKIRSFNLPLIQYHPINPPSEYGANYIEFYLEGEKGQLRVYFDGFPSKLWSVDVIIFPQNGNHAVYDEMDLMDDPDTGKIFKYKGSLAIDDIGTYEKVVLVISNLGDGNHDPDDMDWKPSSYSLNVEILNGVRANIVTNKSYYFSGDNLNAQLVLSNPMSEITVDVVAAFGFDNTLFFYPDWGHNLNIFTKTLMESSTTAETILDIIVPDGVPPYTYTFYTALLDHDTSELICDINKTSIIINIKQKPTADFTITPESGTTETRFELDASTSSDVQDDVSKLRVRWDWEGQGYWTTEYRYEKRITLYPNFTGELPVRMEVIDTDGFTDEITKFMHVY